MATYCMFDVREVTDPAAMEAYRAGVMPVVNRFGGRYVVIGGPAKTVEGERAPIFPVIIEFPDMAAAERWYGSEAYRALRDLRLKATVSEAVFVEGLPTPGSSRAPSGQGRHDLYRLVHKGLRRGWALLLARIGAGATRETLAELSSLIALTQAHLTHEDAVIHAALEERMSGAATRLDHDHREHETRLAALKAALAERDVRGPCMNPDAAHGLYLQVAAFVAADFAHMDAEETEMLPRLWDCFSDDELRQMEGRIVAAMPQDRMLDFLRLIVPAVTPEERSALLAGMRAGMPAEAFRAVLDGAVRPVLTGAEWAAMATDLAAAA